MYIYIERERGRDNNKTENNNNNNNIELHAKRMSSVQVPCIRNELCSMYIYIERERDLVIYGIIITNPHS